MEKPAALFGSYVDAKFMRGLKVLRVMTDVPIERSKEFFDMFGVPDGADPVPVVLMRLTKEAAAEQSSSDVSRPTESPLGGPDSLPQAGPRHNQGSVDRERTPFAQMACSQQAALKIRDAEFCNWLMDQYPIIANAVFENNQPLIVGADKVLKKVAGISSKRELDTNPEKAEAWKKMLASYEYRGMAR